LAGSSSDKTVVVAKEVRLRAVPARERAPTTASQVLLDVFMTMGAIGNNVHNRRQAAQGCVPLGPARACHGHCDRECADSPIFR
jgi:hypothetical protein